MFASRQLGSGNADCARRTDCSRLICSGRLRAACRAGGGDVHRGGRSRAESAGPRWVDRTWREERRVVEPGPGCGSLSTRTRGRAPACSPRLTTSTRAHSRPSMASASGCWRSTDRGGLPPRFEVLDRGPAEPRVAKAMVGRSRCFREDAALSRAVPGGLPPVGHPDRRARARRGREWDHCGTEPPSGLAVVAAVEAIVTRAAAMVVAALDMALALAVHCQDPTDKGSPLRLGESPGASGPPGPDDAMGGPAGGLGRGVRFGGRSATGLAV